METTQKTQATLGIRFGALASNFAEQIKSQGFKYDAEKIKHFEKLNECITHLMFSDLLNDAGVEKARKKLFTQIKRHVNQQNKQPKTANV